MPKVIFSIQYEIDENKREEYFTIARELKSLLKVDGLEDYRIFQVKGKKNNFQEIYIFSSPEAYENFDDNQNERISILLTKLNSLVKDNSTKYTTLNEVVE